MSAVLAWCQLCHEHEGSLGVVLLLHAGGTCLFITVTVVYTNFPVKKVNQLSSSDSPVWTTKNVLLTLWKWPGSHRESCCFIVWSLLRDCRLSVGKHNEELRARRSHFYLFHAFKCVVVLLNDWFHHLDFQLQCKIKESSIIIIIIIICDDTVTRIDWLTGWWIAT